MSFAEYPERDDGSDRLLAPHADRMNDDLTPPQVGTCEICWQTILLYRGVVWTPGYPPEPHDDHIPFGPRR